VATDDSIPDGAIAGGERKRLRVESTSSALSGGRHEYDLIEFEAGSPVPMTPWSPESHVSQDASICITDVPLR